MQKKVGILGAGSWGKALTHVLVQAGHEVHLWGRGQDIAVLEQKDLGVILAVPTQAVREVWSLWKRAPRWCWIASKGIEQTTGHVLSEVIQEIMPCPTGYFGGPHLAHEIQQSKACGATLAAKHSWMLKEGRVLFADTPFLLEITHDLDGVQLLGALKNIYAIGYGLLAQQEPGHNMLATFFDIALREMHDVLKVLGGHARSMQTFAGIADFLVSIMHGRNALFGRLFATDQETHVLAEGVASLKGLRKRLSTQGQCLETFNIMANIHAILESTAPKETWNFTQALAHAVAKSL